MRPPKSAPPKLPKKLPVTQIAGGIGMEKPGAGHDAAGASSSRGRSHHEHRPMDSDLEALRDAVILAACKWYSADIHVHPVLSRAEAVKVGVCDLIDAVQRYQNAKALMEPASAMKEAT